MNYFQLVKWFQVLLFIISNSIHQVFLSNINNLHTAAWFHINNNYHLYWMIEPFSLTCRWDPYKYCHYGLEWAWEQWSYRVFYIPRTPRLEPHYQMQLNIIRRTPKLRGKTKMCHLLLKEREIELKRLTDRKKERCQPIIQLTNQYQRKRNKEKERKKEEQKKTKPARKKERKKERKKSKPIPRNWSLSKKFQNCGTWKWKLCQL